MTPTIVHRYTVALSDVIGAIVDVGDCLKIDAVIVGENLVIDVVEPAAAAKAEDFKEVDEPETPPETPPSPPARKGGPLAQRAGILCGEGAFQVWAEVKTAEAAKQFIYAKCGIESRVDLDHEEEAAAKFRELSADYDVWLSSPDG